MQMAFTFEEFPNSDYYNSDLRQILKYMRDFESKLETYDTSIEELQEALENIEGLYTRVSALESATSDLATIRTNISELQTYIATVKDTLSAVDDNLQSQINAIKLAMTNLESEFETVEKKVTAEIASIKNEWDSDFYNLKVDLYTRLVVMKRQIAELYEAFAKLDTQAKNPWRQELGKVGLQQNLNFAYNDLADECLTANQYCKLGLSADEFTDFDLSARQYVEFGKTRLHWYWVYDPRDGFRQDINVVLTSVLNGVFNTMSADEYSALGFNAENYTRLGKTAYQYYSYNPVIDGLYEVNGVLGSQEYTLSLDEDGILECTDGELSYENGEIFIE